MNLRRIIATTGTLLGLCLLVVPSCSCSRNCSVQSVQTVFNGFFGSKSDQAMGGSNCVGTDSCERKIRLSPIRLKGTEETLVVANIFGDRADSVLTFHGQAVGLPLSEGLSVAYRVSDHGDTTWVSGQMKDQELHRENEALDFRIIVDAAKLPKEQYLILIVTIRDRNGSPLASEKVPFGIFRQDGNDGGFPLAHAVSHSSVESPFGFISRTLGVDRQNSGFGKKDLYATRLAGAAWVRPGYAWLQESPDSLIRDGAEPYGAWFPSWHTQLGFQVLPMAAQGYPGWATADQNGDTGAGTNIADQAALSIYAEDVCKRFRRYISHVQFFNEPDFRDQSQVQAFLRSAETVYRTIKQCNPKMKVVAGGLNSSTAPLAAYLDAGLARSADVLDVHNYASSLKQMEQWMKQQAALVERYAPGVEIWSTELAPRWEHKREPLEVADWMVKAYVLGLRYGFSKLFWFGYRPRRYADWDAAIIEEDFNATPRPAFFSYRVLTRKLAKKSFVREVASSKRCRGFFFTEPEGKNPLWALWPVSGADSCGLRAEFLAGDSVSAYVVTDYLGKTNEIAAVDWNSKFRADHPVFVEVGEKRTRLAE